MSSFCTTKATHIFFFSKKFQHICVSFDVNFNESLTNDDVSFVIQLVNYLFFLFLFSTRMRVHVINGRKVQKHVCFFFLFFFLL